MIRVARTADEVAQAYGLEAEVFGPTPEAARARRVWRDRFDPAKPEDCVIAVEKEKVVGLVRLMPRTLIVRGKAWSTGGVTNVCIHSSLRGRGLGAAIMRAAVSVMKRRGFVLSAAVARRAVDGFYPLFGYVGVDAFPEQRVKTENSRPPLRMQAGSGEGCAVFHRAAYKDVPLTMGRDRSWWATLGERLRLKHPNLRWMLLGRRGYAVLDGETVIEAGSSRRDAEACVRTLLATPAQERIFRLPPGHAWLDALYGRNHTQSTRAAWDGGHVVAVLKPAAFRQNLRTMRPHWNALDEF